MADIYAAIASCQQNGIRLLDEAKEKLTLEVTTITKEELKGLKRIYALEYFELAFYLGWMLMPKHTGGRVVPNSPYMTILVTAVIGEHFSLFDTGDELDDGKALSPEVMKMNGRVGNHLTGHPFIQNISKKAGGFDKDGDVAFDLYCESSDFKSGDDWTSVRKPKIKEDDWYAVAAAAPFLFDTMQKLTSDLWHKLCKKKEDAILAGK